MMKKASLSLSIEAIVVLILAIVVMAFALPFISDLFEKTKGGLLGQFPEVEIYATSQNPIGIGNEFYIKEGQERKMSLHVYNTNTNSIAVSGTEGIVFTCNTVNAKGPKVEAVETITLLQSGDSAKIKVIFRGQSGMVNNDICKITIGSGANTVSQSFFLVTR